MAFGRRPVANFKKRAVYKTEFDIFKQSTDIDLISLVSYEEQETRQLEDISLDLRKDYHETSGIRDRSGLLSQNRTISQPIDRNKIRKAYDLYNKERQKYARLERLAKTSARSEVCDRVYDSFARTTSSVLRTRNCARTVDRTRTCYSAREVRKQPNDDITKTVRCKSTGGRRGNERNWNKGAIANTSYVVNGETKSNTANIVNRNINKNTKASTNKLLNRAKSAPAASLLINQSHNRTESLNREKSAKLPPRSARESVKSAFKPLVENSRTERERSSNKSVNKRTANNLTDLARTDHTYLFEEKFLNPEQHKRYDLAVSRETSGVNQNNTESDAYVLADSENQVNVKEESKDYDLLGKTGSVSYFEDFPDKLNDIHGAYNHIDSKDSGFASNAGSPELELRPVHIVTDEQQPEQLRKQVKFAFSGNYEDENTSVLDHSCDVSEKSLSEEVEILSDGGVVETDDITAYDVNTLICDLERLGASSRLSVTSAGCHSNYSHYDANDSLCGGNSELVRVSRITSAVSRAPDIGETKETEEEIDSESINMSKEARSAILETLQDMGVKVDKRNKDTDLDDVLHRSVNVRRKQNDNRNKYEYYMNERTKSFYKQQFKSMDSVGNDENSSKYSSSTKEMEESPSDDLQKGKLFPNIKELPKINRGPKVAKQSKQIISLEHVKHKKHLIPGIGHYHLLASPENDFEITPAGFDSRYDRPIISKDEMEIPPKLIRERSIQKCKSWLKRNINLSPLALQPAKRS